MHLGGGHEDVQHAEILLEAMPHKDAPDVHQVAQLQVGTLERGQVVQRLRGVQVAGHLGQIGQVLQGASSASLSEVTF